jgi:hypothetical protein
MIRRKIPGKQGEYKVTYIRKPRHQDQNVNGVDINGPFTFTLIKLKQTSDGFHSTIYGNKKNYKINGNHLEYKTLASYAFLTEDYIHSIPHFTHIQDARRNELGFLSPYHHYYYTGYFNHYYQRRIISVSTKDDLTIVKTKHKTYILKD